MVVDGQFKLDESQMDFIKRMKVAHVACKRELSFCTRYMYRYTQNKKFIVAEHHKLIWAALERVLKGEITKLIINIAPRYGKTEIAVKNFIAHALALNPTAKFIHLSYSKALALDNSDAIRDIIKSDQYQLLYPEVQIKPKSDAKEKWYTTAGGGVYATATGGQITGFGAGEVDPEDDGFDINRMDLELDGIQAQQQIESPYGAKASFAGAIVIDDPIKPEDADSDLIRTRVNERFDSTIRNRVNSRKTPIIIIMQRLHEDDLCGYVMRKEPGEWTVISLPAIQTDEDGSEHALWEHKHTLEELYKMLEENDIVFNRQYMQNPMPKAGLMYAPFREYVTIPITLNSVIKNYTDTADKGKDFLCSVTYIETPSGMYVTDVVYTDQAMEITEPLVASMLAKHKVNACRVEANNGGEGFKRQVETQTRILGNNATTFYPFTQTKNKEVRIFQKSSEATNLIYMPVGWDKLYPKFYNAIKGYSKVGKNAHDDAPDVITGMCEFFGMDKQSQITPSWANALR